MPGGSTRPESVDLSNTTGLLEQAPAYLETLVEARRLATMVRRSRCARPPLLTPPSL